MSSCQSSIVKLLLPSRIIYRNKNKSNINDCQMLEWYEEAFMESARNGTQEKFQVQNILYTTCEKLSEICRDIMLQFSDSY